MYTKYTVFLTSNIDIKFNNYLILVILMSIWAYFKNLPTLTIDLLIFHYNKNSLYIIYIYNIIYYICLPN